MNMPIKIRVEQMTSPKSGRAVANQFIIHVDDVGTYFQSYSSIIACKDEEGNILIDPERWDWSRTTGKYRNEFLREGIQETRKKIKSGEYKLINLN